MPRPINEGEILRQKYEDLKLDLHMAASPFTVESALQMYDKKEEILKLKKKLEDFEEKHPELLI